MNSTACGPDGAPGAAHQEAGWPHSRAEGPLSHQRPAVNRSPNPSVAGSSARPINAPDQGQGRRGLPHPAGRREFRAVVEDAVARGEPLAATMRVSANCQQTTVNPRRGCRPATVAELKDPARPTQHGALLRLMSATRMTKAIQNTEPWLTTTKVAGAERHLWLPAPPVRPGFSGANSLVVVLAGCHACRHNLQAVDT
jgi:hypothetical protein